MSKTALITGASRGIGAACAEALARDGYSVIINYLNSRKQAEALAARLGGAAVRADVSDADAVRSMLQKTGGADVLVLCAGVAHYGLLTDMTDDEQRRVLDVNLGGAINCCRAYIPHMVARQCGGIIMISSVWGTSGASCEAVYSASKAGIIGLTKALAKELGPSGIRVNCVAPGVIDTEMLSSLSEDDLSALREETPLMRLGTPVDVANAVSFLASDRAAFITGQILGVDGGFA